MNTVDFLSKVSLFSEINEVGLKTIAKKAKQLTYQKGEVIIKEGDIDNRLFIILRGSVQVLKDYSSSGEKSLGLFGPYSYFGEMALIDEMARSASVVAREETHVLCLEQWDLYKELNETPAMAFELLRMLSRRLRANEKLLTQTLGTLLPICAACKKIRERDGSWISIEEYIRDQTGTEFSHGICPECAKALYPGFKLNCDQ